MTQRTSASWTDGNAHSRLFTPNPPPRYSTSRPSPAKKELRSRIAQATEEFLASGGRIQHIPGFETTQTPALKPRVGLTLTQEGA